jgi:excisionase family DNA binding protein
MATKTVSVREAARRLGWTLKYVYDLLYSGRLLGTKVGRKWSIPASAVEELLSRRGS